MINQKVVIVTGTIFGVRKHMVINSVACLYLSNKTSFVTSSILSDGGW